MKLRDLIWLPACLLSLASLAQEPVERVNINLSGEAFERFVTQVEAQTARKIYYRPDWFADRNFTYRSDSVNLDDAFYEVLKGTGLHFNFIDSSRVVILPEAWPLR